MNDILNSADKGKTQKEKVSTFAEPVATFAEPTPDPRVQVMLLEPRVEVHWPSLNPLPSPKQLANKSNAHETNKAISGIGPKTQSKYPIAIKEITQQTR